MVWTGWRGAINVFMLVTFGVGLTLLASQHLQHVVGALPYLLLLACPLLHFFGHGHHPSSDDSRAK